ncbi:reverse transcriptase domain-containing protein [Tanacetum coccineum]
MPTWCHMFNSTLTGNARVWFDDLSQESIDSYDDLKKVFLENYLQQKKCIKDPVEIHNIKQRDGVAVSNRKWKKSFSSWKQQEAAQKQKIQEEGFSKPAEAGTKVGQNASKLCESHEEVGHTTNECMHLKRQIKEMLKLGKLLHLIKELKQSNEKDQEKAAKKGETSGKDKSLAILMVQLWQRVAKQRITQTFSLDSVISFPPLGEEDETEVPMIIKAKMGGHFVHRMYVDGSSSSKIMYEHCFNRFRPEVKNQMVLATTPVVAILIYQNHRKARSKEDTGISVNSLQNAKIPGDERNGHITAQQDYSIRMHKEDGQKELCGLLRRNLDIFAWKPADMTGVPWHIAEHRLNIREGCLPVRQKKRGQAPKRNKVIYEEVEKLVDAGIMKEVHYHSWLSNPVMVKKHNDGWSICVDFKDLNKVCPKDGYPLLEIDWKVESLYGYPFKCFLDAYKGYHQIQMEKEDEENIAFITSQEIFCYLKISFGLKNARATYQRLVDKAFQKQIGQRLEVYVDDLVIKSRTKQEVIRDIEETFKTLREINMKLNPKKCAFGMREGTFLGFAHLSKKVLVEELKEKSINEREVLAVVEEEGCIWITPIYEYLTEEILPEEKKKAQAICRKA